MKLVLIGLLLFFTSPTATHALVKAALAGGLEPLCREFGADDTAELADEAAP